MLNRKYYSHHKGFKILKIPFFLSLKRITQTQLTKLPSVSVFFHLDNSVFNKLHISSIMPK